MKYALTRGTSAALLLPRHQPSAPRAGFVHAVCHGRKGSAPPTHPRTPVVTLPKCCDLGFHASLARTFRTYLSAEYNLETSRHEGLDVIENAVDNLDSRSDKHTVMDMCNQVFCPPLKFEFQPHMGDEVGPLTTSLSCLSVFTVAVMKRLRRRVPSACLCHSPLWNQGVPEQRGTCRASQSPRGAQVAANGICCVLQMAPHVFICKRLPAGRCPCSC